MGLNQDQLANALSLALVPHMPMYVCHVGIQSMWKGTHSAEQVRNGIWGAMLAREGMTGPCTPFEGRDGLIAHIGPFTRDLRLPASADGRMALETIHANGGGYKRVASEGNTQNFHQNIAPALIAWAKPEEIASIDVQFHYFGWQEISDPPKWDPRNRETADHSMPYNIARHILDKQIYLDSFTKEKYMDPAAREPGPHRRYSHAGHRQGGPAGAQETGAGENRLRESFPRNRPSGPVVVRCSGPDPARTMTAAPETTPPLLS
jgi:2-methylcitrate dehydratase